MLDSVRTRLTLWYVAVLALVLLAFSIGVYALLARNLHQRLETGLRGTSEAIAAMIERERGEGESEQVAAKSAIEELHYPQQGMAVYDAAGNVIAAKSAVSGAVAPPPIDLLADASHKVANQFLFQTSAGEQQSDNDDLRVTMQRVYLTTAQNEYLIVVAQPLATITEELAQVRKTFLVTVPLALLMAGVGGWLLARKSLAPVVEMSAQARRLSAENLSQRLPVSNTGDELGQLAITFNELLGRLQMSFEQQRQFMTDASHELRTPLFVARTTAEVTLEPAHREESEYRDALAIVKVQTQRLTRIVEEMFMLARADASRRELQRTNFYLDELLAETVHAAAVLAERSGVAITTTATETEYQGDEGLLRQMLLNLLDNAIKHTPSQGNVNVTLAPVESAVEIHVTDTGTGIPPEMQPQIFERFFRGDKARSRSENGQGSGAGLGLSIARWIAEAHGGTLILKKSDSQGSTFAVSLPLPKS